MRFSFLITIAVLGLSASGGKAVAGELEPTASGASPEAAAPPSSAPVSQAVSVLTAKAGPGQKPLRVTLSPDRKLIARACATRRCDRGTDTELPLPPAVSADLSQVSIKELRVGQKRHAIWVEAPHKQSKRNWHAVFGVRPGSAGATVLFQGWEGYGSGSGSGIDGERHGLHVQARKIGKMGNVTLLVSDIREDLTLCGRPALLAPRALSGHDLKFHGATISRLPSKERAAARKIKARPVKSTGQAGSPGLLRAVAASSAIGNPAYLTDGDDATTWAEARTGDGRGEFVIMRASSGVPLSGFEFTVRTDPTKNDKARSPDEVWVVTDDALFDVRFPSGAFRQHGTYAIDLPSAVTTQCVAVVLGRTRRAKANSEVSLTEITAVSPLASEPVESLIAALDSAAAEPAIGMLIHRGEPAYVAVAKAYPGLSPSARGHALDVLDHATCEFSGATYAEAVLGADVRQRAHAASRVGRCREQASEVFVAALDAPGVRSQRAAEQLADLDPGLAVEEIVVRLPAMSLDARRLIRPTIARSAASPRAEAAVRGVLARDLSPEVTTEVLRLSGPHLSRFQPEAGAAFARLATQDLDFRSRYLLIEPAASLATSDAAAAAFLRSAMADDPDPRVRAKAARAVSEPQPFVEVLVVAASDGNVRVREAATRSLLGAKGDAAEDVLRERLESDAWPMVRMAAADALREASADDANDEALAEAIADPSRHVRQVVVLTIGARGARAAAPLLRERLVDVNEHPEVRSAAADALASLCDVEALDALTKLALVAGRPGANKSSQIVAAAALRALGRLSPPDLDARIAPLLAKDQPRHVRGAAERALLMNATCGPGAAAK